MQKEIQDYCDNFYALRQNRPLDISELLDVTIFIMIEANDRHETVKEKEAFALGILKNILNKDIINMEENRLATAAMEYYVKVLKRQLLKDTSCCIYSLLKCC